MIPFWYSQVVLAWVKFYLLNNPNDLPKIALFIYPRKTDNFEFETPPTARGQTTRQATSKPSLFLAMCQTYGLTFVTNGLLKAIYDVLNFVGPLILK